MQRSALTIANRILPGALLELAKPLLEKVDELLFGDSDNAVSQRMAMVAFVIRVASAAIAYLSQVLLARWMGSFEYGIFVAVWVAVVIMGGLACLGFETAVIRFISEYRETQEDDKLRGAIIGSMSYTFAAATVIAMIGLAALYFFGELFTSYYIIPIFLALFCLPMLSLQEAQDGVSRAYNWPITALGPTFILRPILILVVMAVAILSGFEANAITAMASTIVAVYVATATQFISLFVKLRRVMPTGKTTYLPKQWIMISMPIFLVAGFYNLLTSVDIIFVSNFMEPEKVGVYFATVKTLALVHFVYFAVKAATAHRFSAYKTAGDQDRYETYVVKTVHWIFWPSVILALSMMMLGKYFLMLFGPEFVEGQKLLWILALGIIVRSTVGAAESVLTMSGEQRICAIVYGIAFMINVALNLTLIPIYGLSGAAAATALAMLFETIMLYAAARKRLGLHIFVLPNARQRELLARGD